MTTDNNYQAPTANETDADGNEVPPPDAPPPPTLLNVKFSNQTGDELHFKMKPTTKLSKAMVCHLPLQVSLSCSLLMSYTRTTTATAMDALVRASASSSRECVFSTIIPQQT